LHDHRQTDPTCRPGRGKVTFLLTAVLATLLGPGCTHTYALRLDGVAAPGSQVKASYWAQPASRQAPLQQEGPPVAADGQGRFSVLSATVLDFAGPPSHVTLEVSGLGPLPLCAVVPTTGLWDGGEQPRALELPPLRPLAADEVTYELAVPGLARPLQVIRMDPAKQRCISPGG